METPFVENVHLSVSAALYAAVPGLYKPENKITEAEFRQELTGNDIK